MSELGRLLPWVAAAVTSLLWANTTFAGFGASRWKDLELIATTSTPVATVPEFLRQISEEDAMPVAESPAEEHSNCCSRLVAPLGTACSLTLDDTLLEKHWMEVLFAAFPEHPKTRLFHTLSVAFFKMLPFVMPALLVVYSLSRMPQIVALEVLGGVVSPTFVPTSSEYFISLETGWKAELTLKLEMEVGQASRVRFCCHDHCETLESTRRKHSEDLLMAARVPSSHFGTCSLILYGLRTREYVFTVLALQGVQGSASFGNLSASLPVYEVSTRDYVERLNADRNAELHLRVNAKMDTTNIKVEHSGRWCGASTEGCRKVNVSSESAGIFAIQEDLGGGTYSLMLVLRPKPSKPDIGLGNLSCSYTFQVVVVNRDVRLAQLAQDVAELRATVDALEDFDQGSDAAATQQKYKAALQERDGLLEDAYRAKQTKHVGTKGTVTFLAVGLTGTGKSELCHWMTGDKKECSPSATMESHTSKVTFLHTNPFNDSHILPKLEWIDTPGRGDTRGEAKDEEMWNQTIDEILRKSQDQRIDRIVWVLNAAWQRGVAMREMMLKELRRSFGYHLYEHLDLVFNFLPHLPNKTEYREEVLFRERKKFTNWIMEQEDKLFNWSTKLRHKVSDQVNRTGCFGVSINPAYLADRPADLPLSAPYLRWFTPFSYPAGMDELIRMYETSASDVGPGLRLNDKHPRTGPGILKQASLVAYVCGLRPEWSETAPTLTRGAVAVHMQVEGEDFDWGDNVIMMPTTTSCGDPGVSRWSELLAKVGHTIERNRTHALYRVPWQPSHRQFCFCEAPGCNESWRFGQSTSIGQIRPPEELCNDPISNRTFDWDLSYAGLVAVGDIIVAPPDQAHAIMLLNVTSGKSDEAAVNDSLNRTRPQKIVSPQYGTTTENPSTLVSDDTKWCGAVTDGKNVYAAPWNVMDIFVFNVATRTSYGIPLDGHIDADDRFIDIAVDDNKLYLLPGRGQVRLGIVDLSSNDVKLKDLSEYSGGQREADSPWLGAVVDNGQLFLIPHGSPQLVVMEISSEKITHVDTSNLAVDGSGLLGNYLWAGGVKAKGHVYTVPHDAERILVIDVTQPTKIEDISTESVDKSTGKWWGAAVSDFYFVAAPRNAMSVLVMDLFTRTLLVILVFILAWVHFELGCPESKVKPALRNGTPVLGLFGGSFSKRVEAKRGLRIGAAYMVRVQRSGKSGEELSMTGISPKPMFFVSAIANPMMKVGTAVASGLLAVKWLLAGEEAGLPLIACFLVITVNTELLTTVSLVTHLRAILVDFASCNQVRVKFMSVTSLEGAPVSLACLVLNFVGSSILLVYLYEHPGKFLAWQSATLGLAAWANTSFTGIGTTAWNDIRPLAATSHPVLSVSEFLNQLHLDGGASSASASAEAVSGNSIGAMLSKLCLGTWYFNEEDGLLVQSRRQLLHHALPLHPRLRLVHSSILSFISLLSLAVPALLVGYCMLQTPQLQLCEVVGGSIQPEFDPWASHHYVRVADAWKEVITFNFEMELGQASSYAFCCGSSSCAAQAFGDRQPSNHLLMEARVSQGEFGTCSLKLRGLRQREYLFTILAARSISIEAKLGRTSASFAEHPTQGHLYQSSMALPSRNAQLSFFAAMVLDQTHMRLSPSAKICRRDNQCDTVEVSPSPEARVRFNKDIKTQEGSFNVSIVLELVATEEPSNGLSTAYVIQLDIFSVPQRLAVLAQRISKARAKRNALEGMEMNGGVVQAEEEYEMALLQRNQLLKQVYEEKLEEMPVDQEKGKRMLTFLAVGLTGTGKSELCHWMTGDKEKCDPSSTMVSHTSGVTMLDRHPFKDRSYRMMRWIDTPGRGDTRGEETDKELWKNTMTKLMDQDAQNVDRIVWVLKNAAWQRGVAMREMMLKELRRSFGYHLYEHLDLVFNFLPHLPNKSEYRENVLLRQREKFTHWIMEQEDKLFNWSSRLRGNVSAQVNRTGFYGVSINPTYLADLPLGLPLSAPYLRQFPPFSYPAGVDELVKMYTVARRSQENSSGLKVADKHPRVGPGILQKLTSLRYECGLRPQWSWQERTWRDFTSRKLTSKRYKARMLDAGYVAAHIEIQGTLLTAEDRAFLLSSQGGARVECGDPEEKGWPQAWSNQTVPAVSMSPDGESATYRFDWRQGPLRLCFCEAPNCSESWRFGQQLSLPEADPEKCKNEDMVSTFEHLNMSNIHEVVGAAGVNDSLFAATSRGVVVVAVKNNIPESVNWIFSGELDWPFGLAEASGFLFCPTGPRSREILAIDAATKEPHKVPVKTESGNVTSLPGVWAIAAANHSLYMVAHHSLIIFHRVSEDFKWKNIRTLFDHFYGPAPAFLACEVVNSQLFVVPLTAPHVVVIDIIAFNTTELSTKDYEEGSGPFKWAGSVEVSGRIYAAPFDADRILVITAATPKLSGIDTTSVARGFQKWINLVVASDRIYGLPGDHRYGVDTPVPVLVFDLTTERLYGIAGTSAWNGFGVGVVRDRLFSFTRLHDDAVLVALDAG
ncbi:unnamed protein product, partial [Symbiodinium sp. KB8]